MYLQLQQILNKIIQECIHQREVYHVAKRKQKWIFFFIDPEIMDCNNLIYTSFG